MFIGKIIMNEFYLLFNVLTLINVLILSFVLLFRKDNSSTNKILALIILTPGLNFVNNILVFSGFIANIPYFLFLFQGSALLFAPLVILYVDLISGASLNWFTVLKAFSVLIILLEIYYAYSFSRLTDSEQLIYMNRLSKDNFPPEIDLINKLFFVNMFTYFVVAFYQIRSYRKSSFATISNIAKVKVNYIHGLLILIILLNVFIGICYITLPNPIVEYLGIPLIINFFCVYILIQAFNNGIILFDLRNYNFKNVGSQSESIRRLEQTNYEQTLKLKVKNGTYKITDLELNENFLKIKEHLEKTKPYLDPNINLTRFSSELNSSSYIISMTINCKFEMNFYDLINSYRVKHAKMRLLTFDKDHLTVESVGFESGFSSKSSFYRAFKKHTNNTPTEFLKISQKESQLS